MRAHNAKNNRSDGRFRVLDSKVGYTPSGWLSIRECENAPFPIINISPAGLQFLTKELIEINSKLDMTITCPAFEDPIICRGIVKWLKKYEKNPKLFRVGLEFTKQKSTAKENLKRLSTDPLIRQIRKGDHFVG